MATNAHSITEQIKTILAGFGLGTDDVSYCNSYLMPRSKRSGRGYTYEADYRMFFQKSWDSDRVILHINGIELGSGDKDSTPTRCAQPLKITLQCVRNYDASLNKYMARSEEVTVINGTESLEGISRAQAASVLKWARTVEDLFNAKFPR